jgi:hypothetical protein
MFSYFCIYISFIFSGRATQSNDKTLREREKNAAEQSENGRTRARETGEQGGWLESET